MFQKKSIISIIGRSETFFGKETGKIIESVGHPVGLIKVLEEMSEATTGGVL